MGKPTGFLEYKRIENRDIPPQQRIENYDYFHEALSDTERMEQGARCMRCAALPEWNEVTWNGNGLSAP